MNKANKILLGLLVAQGALAAVTWTTGGGSGGTDAHPLIADLDPAAVTSLTVTNRATEEGKAAETVTLVKKGDAWVVPAADDFPADPKKVDEVVEKLAKATTREPIAESKANHNALNVGERTFEKKVEIKAGERTIKLVLGSAKGSSAHVRVDDGDAVYLARGISAWAMSNRVDTYLDTAYVQVDEPTEVRVQNANGPLDLQKTDDGKWHVAQLPPDAKVDESRVRAFVNAARSVRLAEPVGKTVKPEYGFDGGTLVMVKKGEEVTNFTIGKVDGDFVYVKSEKNDYVVKVRKYSVETLLNQTADKFIEEPPAPDAEGGQGMPPGMMPPGMMPPGMR
ncbi:MAG: DUF4340 domain-containing protein [Myxococcales bacterium]|nr:DUF4340 domain-containing protein [Myxococcales bacterium]